MLATNKRFGDGKYSPSEGEISPFHMSPSEGRKIPALHGLHQGESIARFAWFRVHPSGYDHTSAFIACHGVIIYPPFDWFVCFRCR